MKRWHRSTSKSETFSSPSRRVKSISVSTRWSSNEHPGHLLFPIFCRLLGDDSQEIEFDTGPHRISGMDIDELEYLGRDRDKPRLPSPSVEEIVSLASFGKEPHTRKRQANPQRRRGGSLFRCCV